MILHITNDYSGSSVYKNLVKGVDELGVSQIIYNPIKEKSREGNNKISFQQKKSEIIYSHILNKGSDRIFYRKKIKKIVRDIETKIDLSKIDLIHAHTWYSDGGVAYLLHKKYRIPYIVAVRNTDLNVFYKYLPHERKFGRKILDGAKKIILISASYKNRLLELSALRNDKQSVFDKLIVIPNGVDEFWIRNAKEAIVKEVNGIFNFLYIGKFDRGKNVVALQQAIVKLNNLHKVDDSLFMLHLVGGGGGGGDQQKVLRLIKEYPEFFKFYGPIYDREKLIKVFEKSHVFVMPSKKETFGLVYVEAMLQGLPILFTKNEGIDGFYADDIGEAVNRGNSSEIADKLACLYDNYSKYKLNTSLIIENHDWTNIACIYQKIYEESQSNFVFNS